ncbi:hypothetical protein [Amycolatopsis suaedae]|uniref:ESX-1 secretion-associated protein n=1 Tax=Amycolatopsis suaedae TaxID=2510978 RepID=A0A4Q7JC45_9PSEU|nr:hypothetical protein [Amycolatopsis suaedae]RZQ64093.1 hypothetical protein EWH70_08840 [Amycolatopsis suaedae]
MSDFRLDAEILAGYVRTIEGAAADLGAAVSVLDGDAVGNDAFGPLGKEVGADGAYARAAEALRRQLDDGCRAVRSAADALRTVTAMHTGGDEDAGAQIGKADQR